ncbi:MAG: FmdE family protein [Gemmatimonadota bacterium]|jgi:formylmethanofuran dehydrogenase subunit E
MVDAKAFLDAGLQFHGHKCPAMPLGIRAGAIAMNRLGVARSDGKTLLALVELGDGHFAHCFGDGVQTATGCTFGKGNIKELGYGKFGVTLVDKATSRAVRVVPRGEAQMRTKQTPFFTEYRMKGIPPTEVPDEVVDPLIEKVMSAPEDELFKIGEVFDYEITDKEEDFSSFVCSRCGDMVVERFGRVVGDAKVCIPCREAMLADR